MKNIILFILVLLSVSLNAQDDYIRSGKKIRYLGGSGDTLTASQTVDHTFELVGDTYGILGLAVESDSVSGTPAYSAYLYESYNNEDWGTPIDTITHTGGADDYAEFDIINADHSNYKVSIVATSATQKSNLKIWGKLASGFVVVQ